MAPFARTASRTAADAQRLIVRLLEEPAVAGRLHRPEARWRESSGALMVDGVWTEKAGAPVERGRRAIAKVGVHHSEVEWMGDLFRVDPGLVPTLYASGLTLGGEPLAWMVMERCRYRLGWQWQGAGYGMLMEAGMRFYLASRKIRPRVGPADENGARFLEAIRTAFTADVPPPEGAERVIERFEEEWAWVLEHCTVELCHGDLHPGNAVARHRPLAYRGRGRAGERAAGRTTRRSTEMSSPSGKVNGPQEREARALLIDFAPAALPWVYEPAYCSILWWFTPTPNGAPTLVHAMAASRGRYGLDVPPPAVLDRMTILFLGWHALRFWHYAPHRYHSTDYEAAARRFVADSAAL